jgi:hypothetical protein
MEEKKVLTTLDEVKAISDPYKYRILMSFYNIKEPATVKQIADSLKEVPAKVYYHVKKMEKLGILKLIYTKEIKGIIAKYYEPTAATFDIKCTNEAMSANKNLMLAESQRLLGEIYDTSKNSFFDQLIRSSEQGERTGGTLSLSDLYLTAEEAEEFANYFENFINRYESKDRLENNLNKYHCFISFFKTKND